MRNHLGFTIETASGRFSRVNGTLTGPHYRSWVSDCSRVLIGYGIGKTRPEAVQAALADARARRPKDIAALVGLEKAYFGPGGSEWGQHDEGSRRVERVKTIVEKAKIT